MCMYVCMYLHRHMCVDTGLTWHSTFIVGLKEKSLKSSWLRGRPTEYGCFVAKAN